MTCATVDKSKLVTPTLIERHNLRVRRYDLDWIRVIALGTVIIFHLGMYYSAQPWVVNSGDNIDWVVPALVPTAWRSLLFFFVSGLLTNLTPVSVGSFIVSKSKRLLVPLVFGMLFVIPMQSYVESLQKLAVNLSFSSFLFDHYYSARPLCSISQCLGFPAWKHLWYLAYLLFFSLIIVVLLAAPVRFLSYRVRKLNNAFRQRTALITPLIMLVALRYVIYRQNPGIRPSEIPFIAAMSIYFVMFILGAIARGADDLWSRVIADRAWYAGLAALVCAVAVLEAQTSSIGGYLAFGAYQWLSLLGIVGYAGKYLTFSNSFLVYVNRYIICYFILHQTLIVVLGYILYGTNIHPALGGLLICALTLGISALVVAIFSRTQIFCFLFGIPLKRH